MALCNPLGHGIITSAAAAAAAAAAARGRVVSDLSGDRLDRGFERSLAQSALAIKTIKVTGRSSETALRSLILFAGVASLILILVLGALQWRQDRGEDQLRAEIARSHERQRLLADYLGLLKDAETGQRGYLVTGNPVFLEPFNRARAAIGLSSVKLDHAFHQAGTVQDVRALKDAGARRVQHAQAAVDAWRNGRQDEALALIRAGGGKRLMDEARAVEERLVAEEERRSRTLLLVASGVRSQQQTGIFITEFALLAALLVMVIGLARMVRRLEVTGTHVRDAATRQAAIFETATDAMMMLDNSGVIEATNAAAERLFGQNRADLVGRSNLVLFKNPPAPEVSRAYLERLAMQPELGGNSQDFVGLRADGSEVETEVVTTPVRLEDGLHFLAVAGRFVQGARYIVGECGHEKLLGGAPRWCRARPCRRSGLWAAS